MEQSDLNLESTEKAPIQEPVSAVSAEPTPAPVPAAEQPAAFAASAPTGAQTVPTLPGYAVIPLVSAPNPAPAGTKKKKTKLSILIAAILLVLAGGAAALYFLVLNPGVKQVSIRQQPEPLYCGETTQLTVKIEPAKAAPKADVTWISSDPSVATVDQNGVVTATGKGTCTITAKVDGKEANVTIKAYAYNKQEELLLGRWHADTVMSDGEVKSPVISIPLILNDDLTGSINIGNEAHELTWRYSETLDDGMMIFDVKMKGSYGSKMVYTTTLTSMDEALFFYESSDFMIRYSR